MDGRATASARPDARGDAAMDSSARAQSIRVLEKWLPAHPAAYSFFCRTLDLRL